MKTRSQWHLFSFLVLAAFAGVVVISPRDAGNTLKNHVSAPQVGYTAPELSLTDLSGSMVSSRNLLGKAVILNFWTSWCPPCKAEMPALQQVFVRSQDAGIIIVGVNLTGQDTPKAAADFVEQSGVTFPVWLDPDNNAAHLYAVRSLPTTFFIDSSGVIRNIIIGGPLSESTLLSYAVALQQEGD